MYTNGFVPDCSDVVTIGTRFKSTISGTSQNVQGIYLTSIDGGDIVWRNYLGDLCWLPGIVAGQTVVLGATEIMASGTVNGTARTTTSTNMIFFGILTGGSN